MRTLLAAAFLSPWTDVVVSLAMTIVLAWTAFDSARDIARGSRVWGNALLLDYLTLSAVSMMAGMFAANTLRALVLLAR